MRKFFLATLLACIATTLPAYPLWVLWNSNPDPVDGYVIYTGYQSRVYLTETDVGASTGIYSAGFQPGVRYFFALKSYRRDCWAGATTSGCTTFMSDFSPEISFILPSPTPTATATATPTATAGVIPSPVPVPSASPRRSPGPKPSPWAPFPTPKKLRR